MSKFYSKLFAKIYDPFMKSFELKIEKDRYEMLHDLNGQVLDVGSGTGVNFKYFNKNVQVLAVEPSKEMQEKSIEKIGSKNIKLLNFGVNDNRLIDKIEEKSLDAIVCTLVLCTIPNPEKAIENFKIWLKPAGKLIIIEHVHSDNNFQSKLENILNPIWKKIAEGCNLNRKTEELILEKGFIAKESSSFKLGLKIHKGIYQLAK